MPLSVEQIEVTSFETTGSSADAVAQPRYTPPEANCYSPFCIPTALPEQCPETANVPG